MNRRDRVWGAHACGVLANAFCIRELLETPVLPGTFPPEQKFVAAECGDQHATSVRSPEKSVRFSIVPAEIGAIP